MLNHEQMQAAIAAAKRRFDLIRQKYPQMKSYLVLSLPGGQTGIDFSPAQILKEFPVLVIADSAKVRALEILHRFSRLEKADTTNAEATHLAKQKEQLRSQLEHLIPQLRYDEKCQVELRFKIRQQTELTYVNFDTVWKLQVDELVDRNLTPQTKASIRIVLGTLSQFYMEA
jgi:hypothetical protein